METDKKLIFSTGAKGGVGKSTLAILMVEALREGGNTVASLEGDEHSPSLGTKYSSHPKVRVASVDLSSLMDEAGMELLGKAVGLLDAEYVIVNTPASGVRIFDEFPMVLATLGREPRATWSLAINADRTENGADDDGLFTSMDNGMLTAIDSRHVAVVRPLFQCSYRAQPFWYDNRRDVAERLGLRTMEIPKFPASTLAAIHRVPSSISELAERLDPILSATLLLTWHRVKTALAGAVLEGEPNLPSPSHRSHFQSARRFSARVGLCSNCWGLRTVRLVRSEVRPTLDYVSLEAFYRVIKCPTHTQ